MNMKKNDNGLAIQPLQRADCNYRYNKYSKLEAL